MPHASNGTTTHEPVEILVESQEIVLRALGAEEPEPAVLSGELVLNLADATNIKDVELVFSGRWALCYDAFLQQVCSHHETRCDLYTDRGSPQEVTPTKTTSSTPTFTSSRMPTRSERRRPITPSKPVANLFLSPSRFPVSSLQLYGRVWGR